MAATHDAVELRETLELLGIVVASLSGRVDDQTTALERLTKTAAETRAAAKADLDGFIRSTSDVLETRRCQIEGLKTRNRIPLIALLALALMLATAAITPWAMAQTSGELLCKVAGGFWFTSTQNCTL